MTFVRELEPTVVGQRICLVRIGDDYYAVSSIPAAPDHGGPETLAFAADEFGEITSWTDVAGGRGKSREETIAQLVENGPEELVGSHGDGLTIGDALSTVMFPPGDDYYVDGGRS